MSEKKKLAADGKLIQKLFDCVPLDWSRRGNGDLVFLNEAGQKFVYTDEEVMQKLRAHGSSQPRAAAKPKAKSKTKSKSKSAGAAGQKKAQPAGSPPAADAAAEEKPPAPAPIKIVAKPK